MVLIHFGAQLLGWSILGRWGPDFDFHSLPMRIVLSLVFLLFGFFYWMMNRTFCRFWIGLFEIAVGMWSNWQEIAKMAPRVTELNLSTRILFVVAGVALISKGFDDATKGYPRWVAYRKNPKDKKGWIEPLKSV